MEGTIAQLVEQRTENPCVTGSNPVGTTVKRLFFEKKRAFFYALMRKKRPKPRILFSSPIF